MSLHKDIHQNMQRVIQELEARGSYYISPGLVALKVYDLYSGELEEPHISYACYEHYKQMARQLLAEKTTHCLQDRYPVKIQGISNYKPLAELTEQELLWNYERLRKAADAMTQHATTLLIISKSNSQDGAPQTIPAGKYVYEFSSLFSTTPQKSRLAPDSATALAPLVRLHRGMPVTDSLAIAREFKRLHKNVLATLDSLIADSSISRLDFKPAKYLDTQGKQRRAMELTERGALIAMPFIGGKNSRTGQVRLVDAFMQLRQQTVEKHAETWKGIRQHVAAQKQEITVLKPKAQFQVGIYPVAFLRRSCIGSAS